MSDDHWHVLVVEDDRDVRDTVIEALEDVGIPAHGAADGAEALEVLRARSDRPPALVLLDLMMPVMNGTQFRERQLADPVLAAIPVVLLSADGSVDAKARALGTAGFLRKPVKLAVLLETAKRFVDGQRG